MAGIMYFCCHQSCNFAVIEVVFLLLLTLIINHVIAS